ncbi:LANO_0H00584g1_1 [Lachancea nothofagi CBS 11611]|uniref:DNA polymerase epsilon subunit B n=1 Tax=Lachancea nothofagi CBS 11611 TaxID=1266666 RepID=A0A1G4KKW5_9SACH|nr:LANO_0H00584g1_1 [Lachancea nothofagi CBS 11611]
METTVALPVKIPPGLLRPLAYRVLSKKYGLNIKSDGLAALAEYIGTRFGINWRKDSGTFQFLEQFAAIWDQQERGLFIDKIGVDEVIREVKERARAAEKPPARKAEPKSNSEGKLKTLDNILANRADAQPAEKVLDSGTQTQDPAEVDTDDEAGQNDSRTDSPEPSLDWRSYYKVIDAQSQQNFIYDSMSRQYRLKAANAKKSILPNVASNVALFSTRYHILKDRIMRNELFQGGGDTFNPLSSMANLNGSSGSAASQSMTITQIKNLLGRDGKSFLILGLLRLNAKGNWTLEDPSGSLEVDLSQAMPTEGTFYVPGCIILAEGIYYSAAHKFYVASVAHPPGERRESTLEAIGNLDLLGVHQPSNSNYISRVDKELKIRLHLLERELTDHKIVILGADVFLDQLSVMEALRKVFTKLDADPPITLVLQGSFTSSPLFPVMSSKNISATTAYKNIFDSLALLLSNFERLINETTFVFVPGPNDPWTSMVSLGTTGIWPQKPIPGKFTQRINRICKKVFWGSNPTRIAYLSQELVLVRDDMNGRFKRHNILFPATTEQDEDGEEDVTLAEDSLMQEINDNYEGIDQLVKSQDQLSAGVQEARKLVKTILDQGHISPFAAFVRPVVWDLDHTLHLSPIPTTLLLTDTTASQFEVTYNGCKTVNTSSFIHKRKARYVEYIPSTRIIVQDEVHF